MMFKNNLCCGTRNCLIFLSCNFIHGFYNGHHCSLRLYFLNLIILTFKQNSAWIFHAHHKNFRAGRMIIKLSFFLAWRQLHNYKILRPHYKWTTHAVKLLKVYIKTKEKISNINGMLP